MTDDLDPSIQANEKFDLDAETYSDSEMSIMKLCMVRLSQLGCRVWRNNTAQGWVGKSERVARAGTIKVYPGDVIVRQARPLHAGLCIGSADLIGVKPTEITQEMVGSVVGVFLAPEIKSLDGRISLPQERFINCVNAMGGVSGIVRSIEDAEQMVGRVGKWNPKILREPAGSS